MEKPILAKQAEASPSITSLLKMISDDMALRLFNKIVVSDNDHDRFISLKEINLTSKQYYSRLSGILKAGLIKRHKGSIFPLC
jgi:hypothetical protein